MSRLLIATPTYGGQTHTNYTRSIIELMTSEPVRAAGVECVGPHFIEAPLITRSRNTYVTRVLEDETLSHLLFIDADIGFRPLAVTRMLALDEPFVGCICPSRWPDPARIHDAARNIPDADLAREVGHGYVQGEALVREPVEAGGFTIRVRDGFARIAQIGMGLTLIRRDVLQKMAERRAELFAPASAWYRSAGVRGRVFQAFDAETNADGAYLSEDLSFCARWTRDCGGEIWAALNEPISHAGVTVFEGVFEKRLQYEAWLDQTGRAGGTPGAA